MGRTEYSGQAAASVKKRTWLSSLLILLVVPATLIGSIVLFEDINYMLVSLIIVVYTMLPFFMVFEKRKPKAREIVLLAMMTAVTVCVHMIFHITVPIQIGTALVIVAGVAMGPEAGFLVGALARLVCNFYMGQGPWTPWQMFCWGLIGFLAGLAFNKIEAGNSEKEERGKAIKALMGPILAVVFFELAAYISFLIYPGDDGAFGGWRVYAFGAMGLLSGTILQRKRMHIDNITLTVFTFLTTLIIYGGIMNVASMFTASTIPGSDPISFNTLRVLFVTGLPYDVMHAVNAAICVFFIGKPMVKKIERIKIKYGIYK